MARVYSWSEVEEAARGPYQEVKDSPTTPYYTDWKTLSAVEWLDYAAETLEPSLPPGFGRPHDILGARGDARLGRGSRLDRGSLSAWPIPVDGRLSAVHALRWAEGLRVEVEGDYRLAMAGGGGYVGQHAEVTVPPGASARVLVHAETPAGGAASRSLLLELGQGSEADVTVTVADEGPSMLYIAVRQGEGSKLNLRLLVAPGAMTRLRLASHVAAGATHYVRAASLSKSRRRADVITDATAEGDQAVMAITHRGFAAGGAFLVHRGGVRVLESTRGVTAVVDTAFMLADRLSYAVAVPVLEVDTGEVAEARHSALVAPPDDAAVFYLSQRGLSPEEVRELLALGAVEHPGIHEALGVQAQELYAWASARVTREPPTPPLKAAPAL